MIYLSTSCIQEKNIINILELFKKNGIKNIELSGGTEKFPDFNNVLEDFINSNNLNVRLHNYFPPPDYDFVVNIASDDKEIFLQSINHCKNAINLSKKLKANKYAIHAGFLFDPKPSEIGMHNIAKTKKNFFDRSKSILRMKDAIKILTDESKGKVKLYLENNVFSDKNLKKFGTNPFFLTDRKSYEELKQNFDFNLLLDLAHLKVSCKSLNLNFYDEAMYLINCTDYIHISGNDGVVDSMQSILDDKDIVEVLKKNDLKNKTFTLEIRKDIKTLVDNYNFLEKIIS